MYNVMVVTEDTTATLPVPHNSNKAVNDPRFSSICKQVWISTEQKETRGYVKATDFGTPPYASFEGLEQPKLYKNCFCALWNEVQVKSNSINMSFLLHQDS